MSSTAEQPAAPLTARASGPLRGRVRPPGDKSISHRAFLFGLLPQCADELISYTVYRWECAVRSSAVLGLVGAGGLGQMLEGSMKMFAGNEVATILLVFVVLVLAADLLSAWLRRAWS